MIKLEDFYRKYPDLEAFQKDFPVGFSCKWCDRRTKYHIVSYAVDHLFSDPEDYTNVVILKSYTPGNHRWYYTCMDVYVFYSTWEILKREGIEK